MKQHKARLDIALDSTLDSTPNAKAQNSAESSNLSILERLKLALKPKREHNRHSPFDVEVFSTKVQWIVFLSACVLCFCLTLGIEYKNYLAYTSHEGNQELYAQVISQYTKQKNNKSYFVLKLKSESGATFFTTSKEDIKDILHRFVRIYGKRAQCSFIEYLHSCFFNSYYIALLGKRDYRDNARAWIDSQHKEPLVSMLYKTLFMADFLPYVWRDLSNKLGIAHLIAISGFHLGILSAVLGIFFSLVYRAFHRHISYRNKYFDIGIAVLVCMFGYLVVLDYSPSFLRSFIMALCGFVVVFSGIKLLSFNMLFVVVCLCLALFPRLIFSIGFFLSASGVFFIYLFMRYVRLGQGIWYNYILLPILFNTMIFMQMLPLVHYFFPYFTPLCLLCIPLSIAFVAFFPIMLVAHIFKLGFLCDGFLEWAMGLKLLNIEFYTPWWAMLGFIALCFVAIKSKVAFWLVNITSFGFFIYLCARFYQSGLGLW